MPLDGHSYLISQGWSGHGTGLRKDSIIRPLAIPQKRTLAGLGKDRDEAFPFWDQLSFFRSVVHGWKADGNSRICVSCISLFSVAAKTIQVKLSKDDDDDDYSDSDTPPVTNQLDRTTTGILSNKAPKQGTPASGSATPTLAPNPLSSSLPSSSSTNLLLAAKREAAKRTLYSRFFRGPVLGPGTSDPPDVDAACSSGTAARSLSTAKCPADDWDTVITNNVLSRSSNKTPMAIAKAKIATASDAAPPVLKVTITGTKEKKKRKREDDGDGGEKDSTEEKKRKESKEERRMRKEKENAERKERKAQGKKERKEGERKKKGSGDSGDKKSRKWKRSEEPSATADNGEQTPPVDGRKEKKSKRNVSNNEEKDTDKKRKKDKKRSREEDEDEDEDECKRRKRDRKEAKKAALASATSSSATTDADVKMTVTSSSSNPNSTTLNASEKDAPESRRKKKKRKTAD